MPKILISGSLAYDYLYTFSGVFKGELSYNVSGKSVQFGGCAGNIAYNGTLIGEDFILLGIAGDDFEQYEKWLKKNKISTSSIIRVPKEFTSQATVVTDSKNKQMAFFHEGAGSQSKKYRAKIKNLILSQAKNIKLALVSPNSKAFMQATIECCRAVGIPYIFDPGQAIHLFSARELQAIFKNAFGMIVNEYEFELFQKLARMKKTDILKKRLLVITKGEKGSTIYFSGSEFHIPLIKPKKMKDPTGCGDAYRAGFLTGIKDEFPNLTPDTIKKAGLLGARLASLCIARIGTQNHFLSSGGGTGRMCFMRHPL